MILKIRQDESFGRFAIVVDDNNLDVNDVVVEVIAVNIVFNFCF